MNNKKTTASEISQFNREWEEFEMWRDGVIKKITPAKAKPYNFDNDAPNEPVWFQNLQKAWTSTQQRKALKEAVTQRNSSISAPSLEEIREDPNTWQTYCESHEKKRPVGRPRMKPEERKSLKGKIKRSDQMRQLLSDHGIIVNRDNGLEPATLYEGWVFLPNGRVRFEDDASIISVHAFLRDYC
jgi:hypothetical protein